MSSPGLFETKAQSLRVVPRNVIAQVEDGEAIS